MGNSGNLYVLEGPDGVGKTTLAKELVKHYEYSDTPYLYLSFPGREIGTLGAHVYMLHHAPQSFGINSLAPTSLQLLHISAHIDSIENKIIPALRYGQNIVLDRFWWSTWVYGITSGITRKILKVMLQVEIEYWGSVKPTAVFLLSRLQSPSSTETGWDKLKISYYELAVDQGQRYPVHNISNEGTIDETVQAITNIIDQVDTTEISIKKKLRREGGQIGMGLLDTIGNTNEKPEIPKVFSSLAPTKPTIVFDTYWKFAAERQNIFFLRLQGDPWPWTMDSILLEYKFTNAYRASDRVSQYLIKNVIYHGDQSPQEVFFRIILFKLFNKIETWELLSSKLDSTTYHDYSFEQYDRILTRELTEGRSIFSSAYIMPSGNRTFNYSRKHRNCLKLLEYMLGDELPARVTEAKSLREVYELLRSYPMLGNFLAYQFTIDLNYSDLINFNEMEFVVPGPGAQAGIRKCFTDLGGLNEADIIRLVTYRQQQEFERLGLEFKTLFGRQLQLIDCQNLFCEVDKYSRVAHPNIQAGNGRTRIKHKFKPMSEKIDYWYPPKWGINEKLEKYRSVFEDI